MIVHGSPEWYAERAKRLTASDFGAALGLNPYCSRQKLWRVKTGLEAVESNFHMQRGIDNEINAIAGYEMESGLLVSPAGLVLHPEHDWLAATPDGFVGCAGLLETKCPAQIRREPPAYHVAQCLGQLECTGRARCDYAQWRKGEITIVRLHRNQDFWAWALPRLREFWGYVSDLQEPPRMKRPDMAEVPGLVYGISLAARLLLE